MICHQESGIHCNSLLKNELTYQPFSSSEIGKTTELVLGRHSGAGTIRHFLEKQNLNVPEKQTSQLTEQEKAMSFRKKGSICVDELVHLINNLNNGQL